MLYSVPLSMRLRGGAGQRAGKQRASSSGTGSAKKKHKAAGAAAPIPLHVDSDDSDGFDEYVPPEDDESESDELELGDEGTGDDVTEVGDDLEEEDDDDVEENNPVAGDAGAGAAAGTDAAAAARAARRVPRGDLRAAELKALRKVVEQQVALMKQLAGAAAQGAARAGQLGARSQRSNAAGSLSSLFRREELQGAPRWREELPA